jgi:hypothetical protein
MESMNDFHRRRLGVTGGQSLSLLSRGLPGG